MKIYMQNCKIYVHVWIYSICFRLGVKYFCTCTRLYVITFLGVLGCTLYMKVPTSACTSVHSQIHVLVDSTCM